MENNPPPDRQHSSIPGKGDLKLLRIMFEEAPVYMGLLESPDHNIRYMNRQLRDLLEIHPESPGKPARELLTEFSEQHTEGGNLLEPLDQVFSTGEPYIAREVKIRTDGTKAGNGEEGYYTFIYQPLKSDGEQVFGIFITGYELPGRVMVHKKQLHSEQRLTLALEGGRLGYWEVDAVKRDILVISGQWKQHFGRPPEESLTYEDFLNAIYAEDRDRVKKKLDKSMEHGGRYQLEFRAQWPDKSLHWIRARGICLQDENGRPSLIVGVTENVTDQKEAERKLKDAIRLRDDFLSIAAHELQTPVTSMKAQAELLVRQLTVADNEIHARQAKKINERIDEFSRLTAKLLDVSRVRQEGLTLEKENFSLDELINEKVEALSHISHHTIEIQGEEQVTVHADRFRIGQVLTNLIENALKYSPEADRVIVHVGREDQMVIVSVRDFGDGVTEADRERIFERFFKGTEGRKKTYPGFGIGLYIASQIVQRHDGSIWVEDADGQGSVFYFTLP